MYLNTLYNLDGSRKKKKRLGRGIGSGKGKTCGRGVKGQKARAGVAIKGFEGGQMPIIMRLPKRGFYCISTEKFLPVSLSLIKDLVNSQLIEKGSRVDNELLHKLGVIKNINVKVKLLGNETLSTQLTFDLDAYSKTAKEALEKSGCNLL
ncbi:MAG: ribosomal protein [Rickettsiaceae bacterium]|jgi:large subunit ribosomal protein L15|nr:ribosomal protein [Rickettsiaceae bacterium]